ncbi:hypothetical protein M426DRAFT_201169 [Hypoxylon sp. CI-4A]|nr:hypothetical protein M426DRAFT_201169 [Hypoxylon sp. CI-4A]
MLTVLPTLTSHSLCLKFASLHWCGSHAPHLSWDGQLPIMKHHHYSPRARWRPQSLGRIYRCSFAPNGSTATDKQKTSQAR